MFHNTQDTRLPLVLWGVENCLAHPPFKSTELH